MFTFLGEWVGFCQTELNVSSMSFLTLPQIWLSPDMPLPILPCPMVVYHLARECGLLLLALSLPLPGCFSSLHLLSSLAFSLSSTQSIPDMWVPPQHRFRCSAAHTHCFPCSCQPRWLQQPSGIIITNIEWVLVMCQALFLFFLKFY